MNITILQPQWYDGIVATPLNREEITSLILSKMYTAALDLNNTVSFSGYVYSPTGKWSLAEYLMQLFNNLKIDIPTSGRYVAFGDPEVERVLLAHNVGDGIGITQTDLLNLTSLGTWFLDNTTILSFDELSMTGVTSLSNNAFEGCTSLTSVDTSNITNIGYSCFKNCTLLTSVDLSKITTFPNTYNNGVFQGCTSLQYINTDFSNVTSTGDMTFYNCTSLGVDQDLVLYTNTVNNSFYGTKYKSVVVHSSATTRSMSFEIMPELLLLDYSDTLFTLNINAYYSNKLETVVLPSTITLQLSWRFRADNYGMSTIIILATTPPPVENTSNWYVNGLSQRNMVPCYFYVPDSALTAYQSADKWSDISTHILPLSLLPVGVWKTGLYQLYEPYLSNSSDPAYATT